MNTNTPSPGASSSPSLGIATRQFDPQRPFKHVVVCCTSVPYDERVCLLQACRQFLLALTSRPLFSCIQAAIDKTVFQLGGVHKYDLTPDVTHLVVGNYNTPKYRHVAKARPDVIPVAAGWIQATLDLWKQDREMDFAALESTWMLKPLESSGGPLLRGSSSGAPDHRLRLLVCLTGFDDGMSLLFYHAHLRPGPVSANQPISSEQASQRQNIVAKIYENGGAYTGDFSNKVTHLIVRKPEGPKYTIARKLNVNCVALEWLGDSIKRGMILDESCYDPLLPPEKIGADAWENREVTKVALGKRFRDRAAPSQEDASRKLRKTASMKLQSQSQSMWASILGASTPTDHGVMPRSDGFAQPTERSEDAQPKPAQDSYIFRSSVFFAHGYMDKQLGIIANVIRSFGGRCCASLDEAVALNGSEITHRFLVVPQNSQPDTHPLVPDGFAIVTEFYLEKCLHKKRFFDPKEHVLGKPFPVFPMPQFTPLSVAIGGFTDVDLQQVEKAITQLGATFLERFTRQAHVLVCSGLAPVRREKINLALSWKVPIVGADWLWDSIKVGSRVSLANYLIKELHQNVNTELPDAPRQVHGRQGMVARSFSADAELARKGSRLGSALATKASLKRTASEAIGKKVISESVRDDISEFDDDPGRPGMSEEPSFKTAQTNVTIRAPGALPQEHPPSDKPFNTARTGRRVTSFDVDVVSDGFYVSPNKHASGRSLSRSVARDMTEGQRSFAHRTPSPPIDDRKHPEKLSRDDVCDEGITMLDEGSAISFPDALVHEAASTITAEVVEPQEIHAEREIKEQDGREEKARRRGNEMGRTSSEAKAAREKKRTDGH